MKASQAENSPTTPRHSEGAPDFANQTIQNRPDGRLVYLESKLRDDQPIVVIIAGQSSAGKSIILSNAETLGAICGERLMPRKVRAGDTGGDKVWSHHMLEYSPAAAAKNQYVGDARDLTSADRVFFAEHKYQGYYGFPSESLVRAFKDHNSIGYIVGRCEEIPAMIEGIRNIAPLAAICVIRAEVPLKVLAQRLSTRPEAFPGELLERVSKLAEMAHADGPQIPGLVDIYGMRSILNLSSAEVSHQGFSEEQVQPATPERIQNILKEEMSRARERAKVLATDVLLERKLGYGHKFIPNALIDVLDNNLAVACIEQGFVPCIKGGLAVGLYLEDSRPVSLDIDFTACETPDLERRMGELLRSCSDQLAPLSDGWNKNIYHCRGFPGKAHSRKFQQLVELDALTITRIQPNNQGFCYVFPFNALDQFHRRTVELPSGRHVYLCPPEGIIIEKLTAGRSYEVGKFDLFDAAGMLAKLPLDPAGIRRLLDCHYFDPVIDKDVIERLKLTHFHGISQYAEELGISDPTARAALNRLKPFTDQQLEEGPRDAQALTLTTLKRLVLIDQLRASCVKIRSSLNDDVVIANEQTSIAKKFGATEVLRAMGKLEMQIGEFALHELGRLDIYTRRLGTPKEDTARFFGRLDAQRAKLTKTH